MRLIPPAWTLAIAVVQRVAAGREGPRDYPGRRVLSGGLALAGVAVMGTAVWQFFRARTTFDPVTPSRASALVTSGLYEVSRNPIYLADALLLAAHAAWLGRPSALVGIPTLAAVLQPQIAAEETALRERFGSEYDAYVARVPRWLGPHS